MPPTEAQQPVLFDIPTESPPSKRPVRGDTIAPKYHRPYSFCFIQLTTFKPGMR